MYLNYQDFKTTAVVYMLMSFLILMNNARPNLFKHSLMVENNNAPFINSL